MKKQELVHLHGLLTEVLRYCTQEEEDRAIDLSEYGSLDITPTTIYCSKDEHQRAVFVLSDAITEELDDEQTAAASANAA